VDETGQKLSNLQSFLDAATAERYFDCTVVANRR